MKIAIDWMGVLGGQPREWLVSGLLMTLCVTIAASAIASLLSIALLGLRISAHKASSLPAKAIISIFRNTPLLVQLLFWYFAAFGILPDALRQWINEEHPWATLPYGVMLVTPEFIASAWGLGVFSAVFIAEEIRAGLEAVPDGQREAAISQGFGYWSALRRILLPQALRNAYQPVVGQYLNLMKLSSLACSIGLAEITYQVRQIESYNSHALEAFAVGTLLYLAIGLALERLLLVFKPRYGSPRSAGKAKGAF